MDFVKYHFVYLCNAIVLKNSKLVLTTFETIRDVFLGYRTIYGVASNRFCRKQTLKKTETQLPVKMVPS